MDQPVIKTQLKKHWFNGLALSSLGTWWMVSPGSVRELLSEAMQHDTTRMTIAFILAWKIVKRDMKRDLAEEFGGLRLEISKLGEGFKKVSEDIVKHSDRLDKLDEIVSQLKALFERILLK